jgi:hypothetical protein
MALPGRENRPTHFTFTSERSAMSEWSPLEDDVLLKGTLLVVVKGRDGKPRAGKRVQVKGCGFG